MKRVLIILCILALLLTGCSKESGNGNTGNNKENSISAQAIVAPVQDGKHTWQVAGKYTVETKTNIMNYIEGNVWDIERFINDMGWYRLNMSVTKKPHGYSNGSRAVVLSGKVINGNEAFHYGMACCYVENNIYGKAISDIEIKSMIPQEVHSDYWITSPETKYSATFDIIVLFTLAVEKMTDAPDEDPFGNIGNLNPSIHDWFNHIIE